MAIKINGSTIIDDSRGIINAGISTFSNLVDIDSDINIDGSQITYTSSSNELKFADNAQLRFGDGNDLRIYHDSNNSIIRDNGTGSLTIQSNGSEVAIFDFANSHNMGRFITTGAVELYHNGVNKFETTGYGVTVTGIVSATSYYGDGSNLTGVEAASFLFNTGITSSVSAVATGVGSTILTLPPLDGQKYIIHSILASNIAVGNTEVNFVGAFNFDGGETSYFAHQIPIPAGTSVEMLKQPQVLNPNDSVVVRSTDFNRVGADNIIDVYVSYEENTSTDLIGIGIGTVGLALTSTTGIYTSSTYPSLID